MLDISAHELAPGMVIIPPLRTMRYAMVEKQERQPQSHMRSGESYVVVITDIGRKSYPADSSLRVLVTEK
jgi:hypothetical protein